MCPTSPTQHPASVKGSPGGPSDSQDENTSTHSPNQPITTTINPFIHPPMIPQFNYWPYLHPIIVVNQFTPFQFGPQLHFPYFLYPFPAWYYFQQSMMNIPVNVQPMPTSPSTPHGESPIAQSINTGSGTSITNIVTINEIG